MTEPDGAPAAIRGTGRTWWACLLAARVVLAMVVSVFPSLNGFLTPPDDTVDL